MTGCHVRSRCGRGTKCCLAQRRKRNSSMKSTSTATVLSINVLPSPKKRLSRKPVVFKTLYSSHCEEQVSFFDFSRLTDSERIAGRGFTSCGTKILSAIWKRCLRGIGYRRLRLSVQPQAANSQLLLLREYF